MGVKSPTKSQIMIVSSPVGPYYPTGFNPISLHCETHHIRSAPGGTGGHKLGGYFFLFTSEIMVQQLQLAMKLIKKATNKFCIFGMERLVKLEAQMSSLFSKISKLEREKLLLQNWKILYFQELQETQLLYFL